MRLVFLLSREGITMWPWTDVLFGKWLSDNCSTINGTKRTSTWPLAYALGESFPLDLNIPNTDSLDYIFKIIIWRGVQNPITVQYIVVLASC